MYNHKIYTATCNNIAIRGPNENGKKLFNKLP